MFTSSASRHSSDVKSWKRVERAKAALLTTTSTRPKRSRVRRTISSATPAAAISPGTARAGSPIDVASDSARSRSRTFTATDAPRSWKRSAEARPIPRQAPVMTTTRPTKSCVILPRDLSKAVVIRTACFVPKSGRLIRQLLTESLLLALDRTYRVLLTRIEVLLDKVRDLAYHRA